MSFILKTSFIHPAVRSVLLRGALGDPSAGGFEVLLIVSQSLDDDDPVETSRARTEAKRGTGGQGTGIESNHERQGLGHHKLNGGTTLV